MQASVATDAMPHRAATPFTQLAELPARLHHYAFVVRDQEANRHFFEDIIGLPLVATIAGKTPYEPMVFWFGLAGLILGALIRFTAKPGSAT